MLIKKNVKKKVIIIKFQKNIKKKYKIENKKISQEI